MNNLRYADDTILSISTEWPTKDHRRSEDAGLTMYISKLNSW